MAYGILIGLSFYLFLFFILLLKLLIVHLFQKEINKIFKVLIFITRASWLKPRYAIKTIVFNEFCSYNHS